MGRKKGEALVEDKRSKLWPELELEIQKGAKKKDKNFVLSGKWKKFVRIQEGFLIFAVDGEWVQNNLSVIFHYGGHGYVHEFIPLNEIWVATHHPKRHPPECGCQHIRGGRKLSKEFFESAIIHEIAEFKEMKKGLVYWKAHKIALQKEREAEILKDPHKEVN